jgi:hypothetical protein
MVMEYKLIDTANGPLIQNGDQYITLIEVQELISLQEMDSTFIKTMTDFLAERFRHHTEVFVSSSTEGFFYPPAHIHAYITAVHQFLQFKNEHWPRYQHSLAQAMGHVNRMV